MRNIDFASLLIVHRAQGYIHNNAGVILHMLRSFASEPVSSYELIMLIFSLGSYNLFFNAETWCSGTKHRR